MMNVSELLKAHEIHGITCSCGWEVVALGKSIAKEYRKHLMEVAEENGQEPEAGKEAARAEVGRAISAYAAIVVRERSEDAHEHDCEEPECEEGVDYGPDAFVLGWAVALEYSTIALEKATKSGNIHIVAESQAFATSVGLFTMAAREF